MRFVLLGLLLLLALGCAAPPNALLPTRTPRARHFAVGAAAERALVLGPYERSRNRYTIEPDHIDHHVAQARLRGWLAYGVTDRVALAATLTVPLFMMSGQLAVQWNPIRTRYFDLAGTLRGGVELCFTGSDLALWAGQGGHFCDHHVHSRVLWHTAAIAQLGFNPIDRLIVQLQGGAYSQHGKDAPPRVGPWLGGHVYFMISDQVALGPDLAVLPGWFEDGRALVQPSLSLVVWPGRGQNPYRPR